MAGTDETLTLEERIFINRQAVEATLTAAGELRWGNGNDNCLAVEPEVLGYRKDGPVITLKAFVKEFKVPGGDRTSRRRVRRDYVLEMPSEDSAIRWSNVLAECINSLGRPKRLLVLVNPYGGKKAARNVFRDDVKPLLEDAGVVYTMQETEYQLHAQEIALSLDLAKFDGVVCVSGDGILTEVVNGLLKREDWQSAIKMPLGIIPGGTGNGMVKSLIDSVGDVYCASNATYAVIRGHKRSLDVAIVSQGDIKFFSVLMLTWGYLADVDIESEKYRWMGSARLDIYALLRVMNLRKYHGHVEFVPAPGYEAYGEPIEQNDGWKGKTTENKQLLGETTQVQNVGYQASDNQLEGSEWRSIDGPFIFITITNVPWTSEDVVSSPEAKFSDGYLDVVIVKDCSKSALLSLLVDLKDGSYVKSPNAIFIKVKAMRLEPGQEVANPERGGIVDCDGEVIARGKGSYMYNQQEELMAYGPPIQLTVENGLATIFTPI